MPPLGRPSGHLSATASNAAICFALAGALTILACEEDKAPTAPAGLVAQAAATITSDAAVSATPQGTIALPINQSGSTVFPAPLFALTQTGAGPNGQFKISNAANGAIALLGQTSGPGTAVRGLATGNTGRAGSFESTSGTSNQDVLFAKANGHNDAIHAVSNGFGMAGKFEGVRNSGANTIYVSAIGAGNAISAVNTGAGPAGAFFKTSTTSQTSTIFAQDAGLGSAVEAWATGGGDAGFFRVVNGGGTTLYALNQGKGYAGYFQVTSYTDPSAAVFGITNGTGPAGVFHGNSKGVLITANPGSEALTVAGGKVEITNGNFHLTNGNFQVTNGTKSAVVSTATGARALYTEESSEVWFTDYGFGKLANGRARILIDPGFAQTVSLDQPYHVFVEPYGRAELYVEQRTALGFVVMVKDGDPNAEFGYRIVAKRQGFEAKRLERAPWADTSFASGEQN